MNTRKPYPTDLKDQQWERLNELLPHKRTAEALMREYVNGILYVIRTGCSWEMLPHDFPPFQTVKTYFYKLKRDGTWERINAALREQVRVHEEREAEPSLLIVDSQSVKTTEKGGHVATMVVNK
jgi:putative transposase